MNGTETRKKTIPARVKLRNEDTLIILWELVDLTQDQKDNIIVQVKQQDHFVAIPFISANSSDFPEVKKDAAIVIIKHEEAKLDPERSYRLRITVGSSETRECYLKINPKGVTADREKDDKKRHSQMLFWDENKKQFYKLPLEKSADGRLGLPTVIAGFTEEALDQLKKVLKEK